MTFDDQRAVADAGLMLTGTLIGRLGLEQRIDGRVSRGYRPGRKTLTVVSITRKHGSKLIDQRRTDHDLERARSATGRADRR